MESKSLRITNAADYFRTLADLLITTEVSDQTGRTMSLDEGAQEAVRLMANVRSTSGKGMVVGNGGSSAIASHIQNDLAESAGVRAMVFTESPALTARANDYGYGSIFERPIQLWAEPGDLLLTVSSSGKSENIVRGIQAALETGCDDVTVSGFDPGNPSRQMGRLNCYVCSEIYAYVETAHTALTHYLTTSLLPDIPLQSGGS